MSHDPIKLLQDAHRHFDTAERHTDVAALKHLAQGLAKMTESFLTIHVSAKMSRDQAEEEARGGYTMGDGPG